MFKGGDGSHVEDFANASASAIARRFPFQRPDSRSKGARPASAAISWRLACPSSGISARRVEATIGSDARGGLEKSGLAAPVIVVFDELGDLAVEIFNAVFEVLDMRGDGTLDVLGAGMVQTRLFSGALFDELAASGDHFIEQQAIFRGSLRNVPAGRLCRSRPKSEHRGGRSWRSGCWPGRSRGFGGD